MTALRILVTGSRTFDDVETIRAALAVAAYGRYPVVVVHGACPSGADAIAADLVRHMAEYLDITEERHPADWKRHGRRAGFIRNAEMVELGADVCLAFIRDGSRGATHTADLAERAGIPTRRWTA